jgi:hypothetical protein
MDSLGVIENPFRKGGLARVNVGTDTDVPQKMNILSHENPDAGVGVSQKSAMSCRWWKNQKEGSSRTLF